MTNNDLFIQGTREGECPDSTTPFDGPTGQTPHWEKPRVLMTHVRNQKGRIPCQCNVFRRTDRIGPSLGETQVLMT